MAPAPSASWLPRYWTGLAQLHAASAAVNNHHQKCVMLLSCEPAVLCCADLLQDRELLAGHSALLAAQRAVTEKNTAVAAAKQEVWEAKQTITHQAGLLDAVAHDIFNVRSVLQ